MEKRIRESFYNGGVPYAAMIEYIYNGRNQYDFSAEELKVLSEWFRAYANEAEKETAEI